MTFKRRHQPKRWKDALWWLVQKCYVWTLILMLPFFFIQDMRGQYRSVDQGQPQATLTKGWPMRFCDVSGNCVTLVLVGATYAVPVTATGTGTVTGTVQANAGTGTFNMTCISGCGGAATFSDATAFTFGTTPIGNIGAVVDEVATNTVAENSAAIPRMSASRILFGDLKNTQANTTNLNVTSSQGGAWGVTASAGTGTFNVDVTDTSFAVTVTSGTIGQITMPSLTVTSGTIGSMTFTSGTVSQITTGTVQANAGTGTLGADVAKFLGAAVSTANPFIDGGRASTDTVAFASNGNAVAFRADKLGDLITALAPYDLMGFGRAAVTTTAASQILASSGGANYRWAITSVMACNLSGVVAGNLEFTDSTGTLFTFPWTQTATTAGESRCYMQQFPSPYLSAVNTTISVKANIANATGFTGNITAFKTGT